MSVLEKASRIHFIGIGGIGMSGIAELLVNLGYKVSGSDMQRTDITDRLASLGARIAQGHDAHNVSDVEAVVYSSAVRPNNPEMVAARERGLAIVPRAEILAELMNLRQGIAVAGAHGKTTTTSMIALVLDMAGLDPTAVIGGRVSSFGSNAKLGRGKYLVAEADESDRSFLKLSPRFAVITNIDREHLEAYDGFDDLKTAFVQFANGVPANGAVIMCADDPHLRSIRSEIKRHVVTYGFDESADVVASDVQLKGFGSACTVRGGSPVAARSSSDNCSWPFRAATTCSTRWRLSRCRGSSALRGAISREALAGFTALSAVFSAAVRHAVSSSSKITDTTRLRSQQWLPRHGRSRRGV